MAHNDKQTVIVSKTRKIRRSHYYAYGYMKRVDGLCWKEEADGLETGASEESADGPRRGPQRRSG